MKQERPKARTEGVVFQQIEGERLVHDLATGETFCLDQTATRILAGCDGQTPVSTLLRKLQDERPESHLNEDALWVTLEELRRYRLLEPASLGPTRFEGLSRRAMLKKAGLAAAAAAPAIYLVTSQPLHAQSSQTFCGCSEPDGESARDNACSCVSNLDCCSGICSGPQGSMTCAFTPNANPAAANCCSNFVCDCSAASGSSGRPNGCDCVSNLDCCSGICSGPQGSMTCAATPNANPAAAWCCVVN